LLLPTRRMEINTDEMKAIRNYGRRLYTYTYGADVRTRKTTLTLGRYNLCAECPEPGKFCICDDVEGSGNIERIRAQATAMIAMGDMVHYVPNALNFHFWPVDIAKFPNVGTNWVPGRPMRIGHAPNHPHFKGTHYLIEAVDKLRVDGFQIELIQVQNVPNAKVIEMFASCDLIADQFIAGFHGYAALEAMALGKPVLCYLRNASTAIDPENCPIVNVSPDTLYDTLRHCLEGRIDLIALGRRSRSYVECYCSLEAVAIRLGHLYLETAGFRDRIKQRIRNRVAKLERNLPKVIPASPPVPWEPLRKPILTDRRNERESVAGAMSAQSAT